MTYEWRGDDDKVFAKGTRLTVSGRCGDADSSRPACHSDIGT